MPHLMKKEKAKKNKQIARDSHTTSKYDLFEIILRKCHIINKKLFFS